MILSYAREIAEEVKGKLAPYCERIEIAGSIRREAHDVGDIEIVAIPRAKDAFGFAAVLRGWPEIKGRSSGKHAQRRHPSGMVLDLFMCSAETWACNFLIRTGCKEFSQSVVSLAPLHELRFKDGRLWKTIGNPLVEVPELWKPEEVREEADVFQALDLPWIEPRERYEDVGYILGRLAAREVIPEESYIDFVRGTRS